MSDAYRPPIDPSILSLDEEERVRLARLILGLRVRGLRDMTVLGAIEQVPRKLFVTAEDRHRALNDRPLAIECGQTIPAPSTVGTLLQALGPAPGQRVLEVGTGSGYMAAVIARIAGTVFTLDRYRTLVELAVERFAALRAGNVVAAVGDGFLGWPDHAPFDRILVSGSAPEVPAALLEQLRPEGALVMPVGAAGAPQRLLRLTRGDRGLVEEDLGEIRAVPLVPGRAQTL
ncbi:protein-L-isoaspartate(D-aspartate) O-methyltransferase [Prosthecomicrobium sp. N25]|uniref:protein-L-isoaspartate(D-aspartate) O-methyltransferase n=1 Tax=Prosthecomicrobium sp. N25 TaxID=3129254 RepID=UPI0030780B30